MKINIKGTSCLIFTYYKRQLSQYKIIAMYCGFIACIKVKYMTIIQKMKGIQWKYTIIRFLNYMRYGRILLESRFCD